MNFLQAWCSIQAARGDRKSQSAGDYSVVQACQQTLVNCDPLGGDCGFPI